MKKITLIIGACLGLATGTVMAQSQSGVYIGAGAGIANSNVLDQGFAYSTTSKKDTTSTGYKVYSGYSWGTWSVEGGYYDFGKYSIAGTSGGFASADDYSFKAVGVSLAGTIPVGKDFAITGKLGVASVSAKYHCVTFCVGLPDKSTTTATPLYGIGVSWNATKNVALRLDYEGVSGVKTDFGSYESKVNVGLFSGAVEYRF